MLVGKAKRSARDAAEMYILVCTLHSVQQLHFTEISVEGIKVAELSDVNLSTICPLIALVQKV